MEHQAPFHTGKISSRASAAHSGHRLQGSRPGSVPRWERGKDQGARSPLGGAGGQAPQVLRPRGRAVGDRDRAAAEAGEYAPPRTRLLFGRSESQPPFLGLPWKRNPGPQD